VNKDEDDVRLTCDLENTLEKCFKTMGTTSFIIVLVLFSLIIKKKNKNCIPFLPNN
jgi:hypothetical protein